MFISGLRVKSFEADRLRSSERVFSQDINILKDRLKRTIGECNEVFQVALRPSVYGSVRAVFNAVLYRGLSVIYGRVNGDT